MTRLACPCLGCGVPVMAASRCPNCAPRKAKTAARGYGAAHQAKRAKLLAAAYGQPCARCGRPMLQGQALDLDHSDDRTGYAGFSHRRCNEQAGGRKGARQRVAQREVGKEQSRRPTGWQAPAPQVPSVLTTAGGAARVFDRRPP